MVTKSRKHNTPPTASMRPFRRTALSLAVAAALPGAMSLSGTAFAQQEDAAESSAALEEIVVQGFRRSLENSRAIKMESESIVEAISAEEIGKLPDVSIAESLARLPGLAAQRLNGRGQVISVRGLSPDFTTALLNGRPQVSTGDNRGVEFDQYPSELLSAAVVYKTPDAALIGQGLAGTVDLQTIRPLQHGRTTIAGNVRYEWNSIDALNAGAEDSGVRYSLSYIDQFADDTVGVAIGYAYLDSPSQGERYNAWGYPGVDVNGENALVLGGAKPFVQTNALERHGVVGVLEFAPTDTFNAAVDVFYSDFQDDQLLRGIELPLQWSSAQLTPGSVSNGFVDTGTFNNVKGVMRNDINTRDAQLLAIGLNAEWQASDNWTLGFDFATSQVDRDDVILETYSGTGTAGAGAVDSLGFDLDSGGAVFNSTLDYADPNLIVLTSPQGWGGDVVPGGQVGYFNSPVVEDTLDQIDLQATRFFEGNISSLQIGLNYATREKSLTANEFFLALANGASEAAIPVPTSTTRLDFLGIEGMVSYDPLAALNSGVYDLRRNPNNDVTVKNWAVEEDVTMLYVKLGLDTEWGNIPVTGNFGTQIVHTDQTSSGFAAGSATLPISGGDSYTEILPSVNLNFEVADSQMVRVGVARTLARPRMDDLRASFQFGYDESVVDQTTGQVAPGALAFNSNGGNPQLRPWIANSLDISYERYFDDGLGYVAIAGFYKDLETYIIPNQRDVLDFTGFPFSGTTPSSFLGSYDRPENGSGGSLTGFEFTLSVAGESITPALTGFGAIFSAAINDSDVVSDPGNPSTPLPGLSEEIFNVTLFYENEGFSARVSNRYRSEFLGEIAGFANGRQLQFVDEENIVDAQISYMFEDGPMAGLTLLLQGNNLTDQEFVTFLNDDPNQIRDYQRYGRNFLVGLSYRYE
ncbi:MAG: TonB-dependent receptor [Pseudomonadota bacterium]